mgnify:CR=1 FL=1
MNYFFLAIALGFLYFVINILIHFIVGYKTKTKNNINYKLLTINGLILITLYYVFFILIDFLVSIELNSLLINSVIFLIIAFIPSLDYFFTPVINLFTSSQIKKYPNPYYDKVYTINKEVNNAFATGIISNTKVILISENLLTDMNDIELKSIIFHELGHHKHNHLLKLYILTVIILLIGYTTTFYFYPIFNKYSFADFLVALHAAVFYGVFVLLITSFLQQKFEYQADIYASKKAGKENTINALKKFDIITEGKVSKGGITHPPLKKRILNIEICG